MTGHTDDTGLTGDLHIRNSQIREYCLANNKTLFDFEDIESYDPDGVCYGGKNVHNSCVYDKAVHDDGDWATEWQNAHPGEWYNSSPAHTEALNGNLKAYAAWWLWARLSGWQG